MNNKKLLLPLRILAVVAIVSCNNEQDYELDRRGRFIWNFNDSTKVTVGDGGLSFDIKARAVDYKFLSQSNGEFTLGKIQNDHFLGKAITFNSDYSIKSIGWFHLNERPFYHVNYAPDKSIETKFSKSALDTTVIMPPQCISSVFKDSLVALRISFETFPVVLVNTKINAIANRSVVDDISNTIYVEFDRKNYKNIVATFTLYDEEEKIIFKRFTWKDSSSINP